MLCVLVRFLAVVMLAFIPVVLVSMEVYRPVTVEPPPAQGGGVLGEHSKRLRTVETWQVGRSQICLASIGLHMKNVLDAFVLQSRLRRHRGFYAGDLAYGCKEVREKVLPLVQDCAAHIMGDIASNQLEDRYVWHQAGVRKSMILRPDELLHDDDSYLLFTIACHVHVERSPQDPDIFIIIIAWASLELEYPVLNLEYVPGTRETVKALF